MPERLLTNREVCQRLAVSRTQLHHMTRRGEFPEPVRLGRAIRWRESCVDEWIADLATGGEDAAHGPASTSGDDGTGGPAAGA